MQKTCEFCGTKFISKNGNRRYCSKTCSNKARGTGTITFKCEICGKEKTILLSKYNNSKHHYCSYECSKFNLINNYSGDNSKLYERTSVTCITCGKSIKINKYKHENQKLFFCSNNCKYKYQKQNNLGENNPFYGRHHRMSTKLLISRKNKGKLAWNKGVKVPWKTDIERELDRSLYGQDYINWRNNVYKRDNYTCQCCGDDKGGNLNAHHLEGYNWCKDKRLDESNGITLCEQCHNEFHKIYGRGNNTIAQFRCFIKSQNSA